MMITQTKWGDIEARPGRRGGIEILAMNHERGRRVHVGTIKRGIYEKGNCAILRKPELSICLTKGELSAARESGAETLRAITTDGFSYVISLADFEQHAEAYFNSHYGEQLRTSVRHFQTAITAAAIKPQNVTVTPAPMWMQPTMFEMCKNFPVPCEVE